MYVIEFEDSSSEVAYIMVMKSTAMDGSRDKWRKFADVLHLRARTNPDPKIDDSVIAASRELVKAETKIEHRGPIVTFCWDEQGARFAAGENEGDLKVRILLRPVNAKVYADLLIDRRLTFTCRHT